MSTPPDPCKCCKPRYIKFRLKEILTSSSEFADSEVELYWDGIPPDGAPAPPNPWEVDVYNLEVSAGVYVFSAAEGDVGYAIWDDVEDKYRIFYMDPGVVPYVERCLFICGSRFKSLSNIDGMQKIYLVSASNLDPTTYECHADEHAIELKRTGVYEVVYFARLDPISTSYDSYEAATVGLRSADDLDDLSGASSFISCSSVDLDVVAVEIDPPDTEFDGIVHETPYAGAVFHVSKQDGVDLFLDFAARRRQIQIGVEVQITSFRIRYLGQLSQQSDVFTWPL